MFVILFLPVMVINWVEERDKVGYLSLTLFNTCVEDVIKTILRVQEGKSPGRNRISCVRFEDGTMTRPIN